MFFRLLSAFSDFFAVLPFRRALAIRKGGPSRLDPVSHSKQ